MNIVCITTDPIMGAGLNPECPILVKLLCHEGSLLRSIAGAEFATADEAEAFYNSLPRHAIESAGRLAAAAAFDHLTEGRPLDVALRFLELVLTDNDPYTRIVLRDGVISRRWVVGRKDGHLVNWNDNLPV